MYSYGVCVQLHERALQLSVQFHGFLEGKEM